MVWRADDLTFDIIDDVTDHPVVTIRITLPGSSVDLMGEVIAKDTELRLIKVHIFISGTRNILRKGQMQAVALVIMERLGYDRIVIQGAARTTGACPGRRPRPFRFAR